MPRAGIPGGPQGRLGYPSPQPAGVDRTIARLGEDLSAFAKAKQDIRDTVEANQLLAEFSILAREKQSEILFSNRDDNQIITDYEKELDTIGQDLRGRAKSANVQDLLSVHLPARLAGKINEMRGEQDQRFVTRSLADLANVTDANQKGILMAGTWQEREEIKQRQLATLEVFASKGVLDQAKKQEAAKGFLRSVDLFEIGQKMQYDPTFGARAITHPESVLEDHPNVTNADLGNILAGSVQAEEKAYQTLQRKRKELRESYEATVDEAGIRGQLTWDVLNTLNRNGVVSPETYRRNATLLESRVQDGGIDNPNIRGDLQTRIRLNPGSVSNGEILGHLGRDLSRKTANELLDLKQTRTRLFQADAESTDPRFKGILFREGKEKIDQTVGKGLTISGIQVDDNTRRRWAAASDLYLERVSKERDKPQHQIANEVIELYQGPATPGEVMPERYRSDLPPWKNTGGVNRDLLRQDYLRETDPIRRAELERLIDFLRRTIPTEY